MRPLIIDNEVKASIARMVDYAKANVQTMDDLLDRFNRQAPIPGDTDGYTCFLPFGFKVVFTIEEHILGTVYHMSMSVDTPGKLPDVGAVEEIAKLIGFKNELHDCQLDLEVTPTGHAINVLEVHEPKK